MKLTKEKRFELQLRREDAEQRANAHLSEAPPILAEKIQFIRSTLNEEYRRSIVGRYQIATIIRDIYDDVNDNNGQVYGASAVQILKDAIGFDDGTIYQAINVAETFTLKEIEEIAGKRSPFGKPLTYTHVVSLANVEDTRTRHRIAEKALNEEWTSNKLRLEVSKTKEPEPDKKPDSRGRPLSKPRNFDSVLDQQQSFADDFLNRNQIVWTDNDHSLTRRRDDLALDDYTQERADRLKKLADGMAQVSEKAQERAQEARNMHAFFVEKVQEQAAQHKKSLSV